MSFPPADMVGGFSPLHRVLLRNVIARRKALGFTQEHFAHVVGVHQSSYSRFEAGDNSPSLRTMEAVADALDCSLVELLTPPASS